jgi:hypothetical protein
VDAVVQVIRQGKRLQGTTRSLSVRRQISMKSPWTFGEKWKLSGTVADLDASDNARKLYSRQLKIFEEEHLFWSGIFSEIRKRSDPHKDILFYYAYHDAQEPSKSNHGVLIVRDGKIRDKIILNGGGARTSTETNASVR